MSRRPHAGWTCLLLALAAGAVPARAEEGAVRALIAAQRHAVLSSEIAGRVARLGVEAGHSFKAGQVLVAFDCSSYGADLDIARAQLRAAEVTVRLNRRLNALKSIGESDVELAEAKAEAGRAEVRKAEILSRRCEVKAPFDGRVVERRIEEHEVVAAGTPLVEILSDRDLKVELIVPSSWLVWLQPGQRFDLAVDETGATLPGEVAIVGAKVDPASQSVKVTGRLAGDGAAGLVAGLVAGMSGTARFHRPAPAASPDAAPKAAPKAAP